MNPASDQTMWGVSLSKDETGARKKFACTWIEVMRKNPALADKIRNDRLLESDLFAVKHEVKRIVATMTRQVLPDRVTAES